MPGKELKTIQLDSGRTFSVVIHDLLKEDADCIVNAANGMLAHGGGVAAAVSMAAGRELDREGRRIVQERGPIPTGEAVVTTAGKLKFKGVIHAVGPLQGEGNESGKLVKALKASFLRASELGWTSLSFPAVSSGIFAVPLPVCARAYIQSVKEFFVEHPDSSLKVIRLVLYEGPLVDEVLKALTEIFP